MTIDVDVVVVAYNSERRLAGALQPLGEATSVVVVDNASTDASVAEARRLGADVVANPVNAGFAAAANLGASRGDAELVLFLNPDASIHRDHLGRLAAALLADDRVAVVAPALEGAHGGQAASWPFPSARRAWFEALGLGRHAGEVDGRFAVGACFLVRRRAFEEVGGFDTRFWLYAEEADLCARLRDRGWQVQIVDDVVADHEGGASGEGVEGVVFEHFQRGAEHFVDKRGGARAVVSLRVAELVGSVLRMAAPGPAARRTYHRERARRLVQRLRRRPGIVPVDSPATREPGAGLVVCSLEAWDEVWRRNQFLVRELLRADPNRRVLFVEPAFDVVHERRRGAGRRHQRGLRPLDEDGRIVRFEPRKVLPRALGPFADRSLQRQVRAAARDLGFVDPDLWVNDLGLAGLARTTGWPSTYDITDDWAEAAGPSRARRRVERRERSLFETCGSVVVCSPALASSRGAARPDLVVVPNAVDLDHLRAPQDRPADLPSGPTAVYVGTLHEDRLDVDLLERLAVEHPELSVVLVGPDALRESSHRRLTTLPNVRVLGARPYRLVPGYLQHADVLIVPHVVTRFTESLDPIKAYEYVAAGRPVVATPVAGFRGLPAPVVCAARDEFADAVVAAVGAGATDQPTAEVPSWADRAHDFAAALDRARTRSLAPLDVVFVDHCAQLSGGEVALARLLAALDRPPSGEGRRRVGARVVLGERGPLESRLRDQGTAVEVLELDRRVATVRRGEVTASGLRDVGRFGLVALDVARLSARLWALDPDLVHTNSLKSALYGGVAARLAGVPVVWHLRDRLAADYLPAPAVALVCGLARVVPSAIVVDSETVRDTLGGVARSSRVLVHVIPSIVEAPPDPVVRHRPADAPFRVAMVGRLAPWKGQTLFVDALSRAIGPTPIEAWIVGTAMFGDEEYEAEVRALVSACGLDDRVTFTGFVDDVPALLAEVDAVVHASVVAEPFGLVVVEAMAAGRPVVAPRLGGPGEVISDGVDGLLYTPGDATALAAQLSRLAGDRDLCMRLGDAAARAALRYRPEVIGPLVADCLLDTAARARSPRRRVSGTR
jgi:glycosyltransferase involved in cell wall biosynthesis